MKSYKNYDFRVTLAINFSYFRVLHLRHIIRNWCAWMMALLNTTNTRRRIHIRIYASTTLINMAYRHGIESFFWPGHLLPYTNICICGAAIGLSNGHFLIGHTSIAYNIQYIRYWITGHRYDRLTWKGYAVSMSMFEVTLINCACCVHDCMISCRIETSAKTDAMNMQFEHSQNSRFASQYRDHI